MTMIGREHIRCDAPACSKTNPPKRCSRCHCTFYCDSSCQRAHWMAGHRAECLDVNEMRERQAGFAGTSGAVEDHEDVERHERHESRARLMDERCGICHEEPICDPYTIPRCGHSFCFGCIAEWQSHLKKRSAMTPMMGGSDVGPNDRHSYEYSYGGDDHHDDDDDRASNPNPNPAAPFSLTCPTCRANTPDIGTSIHEAAMMYARRANRPGLNDEERKECRELALSELDKFDRSSFRHDLQGRVQMLSTSSAILRQLDRPAEALRCLEQMEAIDKAALENRRELASLLESYERAEGGGRYDEADAISERLQAIGETKNVRRLDWFEIYLAMAETKEDANDWTGAMELYKWKVMAKMHRTQQEIENDDEADIPADPTPPQQRRMVMGMTRCLYNLEQYDMAIELGESAIDMNRHFPQVHKHVALAHKAKGDSAAALATMARAVQYETPWDEANQKVVLKMFEQLKQEQEQEHGA